MTFPGAHAQIYRNEEGEVIGWDYPSSEPEERDPYDYDDRWFDDEDENDENEIPAIWVQPIYGDTREPSGE